MLWGMAQHVSVTPMTPEQWAAYRVAYAKATRALAATEPDPEKREILLWIAANYERPLESA